jgi:hypothetical protein
VTPIRPEELKRRQTIAAGWPVGLTSYRLGSRWHCTADNVSPGAVIARTTGPTREAAEDMALSRAQELLSHTKVHRLAATKHQ